jgi:ABC-type transport system involved in cytochrome c biogenesis permease subunit
MRSPWFVPHVLACFLAYAALAVSFIIGLVRIIGTDRADDMDRRLHGTIFAGLALLTLGMLMGSMWAWQARGDYWGWDPKEGWALVTWLIYAAYLHLRLVAGWNGRRLAWFAVAGFAAAVFTYVGMNFPPTAASSLHLHR